MKNMRKLLNLAVAAITLVSVKKIQAPTNDIAVLLHVDVKTVDCVRQVAIRERDGVMRNTSQPGLFKPCCVSGVAWLDWPAKGGFAATKKTEAGASVFMNIAESLMWLRAVY